MSGNVVRVRDIRLWLLERGKTGGVWTKDAALHWSTTHTYMSAIISKLRKDGLMDTEGTAGPHGCYRYVTTEDGVRELGQLGLVSTRRSKWDARALCVAFGLVRK